MVIMSSGERGENGLISTFAPRIEEDFPNTQKVPVPREFFCLQDKRVYLLDFVITTAGLFYDYVYFQEE